MNGQGEKLLKHSHDSVAKLGSSSNVWLWFIYSKARQEMNKKKNATTIELERMRERIKKGTDEWNVAMIYLKEKQINEGAND